MRSTAFFAHTMALSRVSSSLAKKPWIATYGATVFWFTGALGELLDGGDGLVLAVRFSHELEEVGPRVDAVGVDANRALRHLALRPLSRPSPGASLARWSDGYGFSVIRFCAPRSVPSALSSFSCWSCATPSASQSSPMPPLATIFESTGSAFSSASVLEQLLRENAAAVEIVGRLVPVLLETGEQVFEADGDGPTLVVLHLHGGAVEAEELPHLLRA